jgi:hypothetical protein
MIERDILIALGIFGLVLFQNLMSVISLEVVIAFEQYENTQINLVAIILVETILTLSHCRRNEKGALRCSTQFLYIWMMSHIEMKKLICNNFLWFK